MQHVLILLVLTVTLIAGCSDEQKPMAPEPKQKPVYIEPKQDHQYQVEISAGDSLRAVYKAANRDEIILLELYRDKVIFTALLSRRKFEEVMTLKPPTYINYEGLEYVKNDLLFWGDAGKSEIVSVDSKFFGGFFLAPDKAQIIAEGEYASAVIKAMVSGDKFQLNKHYWSNQLKKEVVPVFEINAIRENLSNLNVSSGSSFTVRESETRCKTNGRKKIVWLENAVGIFALNGQAIELANNSRLEAPWDSDSRKVELGRDILGDSTTTALIKAGLKKCE